MTNLLRNRVIVILLLFATALVLVFIPFALIRVFSSEFSRIGLFKWVSFWGLIWGMLSSVMLIMSDVLGFKESKGDKRYMAQIAFAFLFAGFGLQFLAMLLS